MAKFKVGDVVRGTDDFYRVCAVANPYLNHERVGTGVVIGLNQYGFGCNIVVEWRKQYPQPTPASWDDTYLELVENGLDVMLKESFGE